MLLTSTLIKNYKNTYCSVLARNIVFLSDLTIFEIHSAIVVRIT